MSRPVTLTKAYTFGSRSFPAGMTVVLSESEADDVIGRGLGGEANGGSAGSAVILSGTSSIVVPHSLGRMPNSVALTGTHAEVQSCIISAVSASSLTIGTGGGANTTANRTVYWTVH